MFLIVRNAPVYNEHNFRSSSPARWLCPEINPILKLDKFGCSALHRPRMREGFEFPWNLISFSCERVPLLWWASTRGLQATMRVSSVASLIRFPRSIGPRHTITAGGMVESVLICRTTEGNPLWHSCSSFFFYTWFVVLGVSWKGDNYSTAVMDAQSSVLFSQKPHTGLYPEPV
jgi:hypothetical protein